MNKKTWFTFSSVFLAIILCFGLTFGTPEKAQAIVSSQGEIVAQNASLQAQINSLLAIVQSLIAQLQAIQNSGCGSSYSGCTNPSNPAGKVVSPMSGESWGIGTTQTIRWTPVEGASKVVISLKNNIPRPTNCETMTCQYGGNDRIWLLTTQGVQAPNTGSFSWRVGNFSEEQNAGSQPSSIIPGTYAVMIQGLDANGNSVGLSNNTSNWFSIVGGTNSNNFPVISGVDGPQVLNVNQTGTWTVKASSPNGGNLSYAVVWGDEVDGLVGPSAGSPFLPQQSATFTHTYQQAGIYTPKFTVTSANTINCFTTPCPSNGGTAQTSLSVNVGSVAPKPLITVISPNGGENLRIGSTHIIRWSDTKPAGAFRNYKVVLTRNSDSLNAVIVNSVNGTEYAWPVGHVQVNGVVSIADPGSEYWVNIIDNTSSTYAANSSRETFTLSPSIITFPPPMPYVSRAQAAQKLHDSFSLGNRMPVSNSQVFNDVPSSHLNYQAINTLYANAITSGCEWSDTIRKFCPGDPLKKWQLLVFLGRILGSKINLAEAPTTPIYRDVPSNHTGFNFIQYFGSKGLITPCAISTDGTAQLCSEANMTESEVNLLIQNATALGTVTPLVPPTLHVSLDPTSMQNTAVDAGAQDLEVAAYKFVGTGEDITIASLGIITSSNTSSCPIKDIKIFDGATQVGQTIPSLNSGCGATLENIQVRIPKNTTKVLRLKVSTVSGYPTSSLRFIMFPAYIPLTASGKTVSFSDIHPSSNSLTIINALPTGTTGVPKMNVAAFGSGATVTASSEHSSGNFPVSSVIDGDKTGSRWGAGGGWNDNTPGVYPDWVQVNFTGEKPISEIYVYTLKDSITSTVVPDSSTTFTLYGNTSFDVQYFDGTNWITVPGGSVQNNNKVMRQFQFSPVRTTKIRVLVHSALYESWSRIVEVEAY